MLSVSILLSVKRVIQKLQQLLVAAPYNLAIKISRRVLTVFSSDKLG
jgi:hypothetical protein